MGVDDDARARMDSATASSTKTTVGDLDEALGARGRALEAFETRYTETRDAYLDNVKYLAMLVVVWNHSLQDFLKALDKHENRGWCEMDATNRFSNVHARAFYLLLNVIGMPVFTCVSGYLSRSWLNAAREDEASAANLLVRVRSSTAMLLGTYTMWQTLYLVINYYDVTPVQWWGPIGVMWYLFALTLWRMSVLVLGALKNRVILGLSLLMGLFVGFTETPSGKNGAAIFDWQRLFVYAVYFFFGLCVIRPDHLKRLHRTEYGKRVVIGLIIMVSSYAGIYLTLNYFDKCFDTAERAIWSTSPYDSTSVMSMFKGFGERVFLYFFTGVASFAFLALVPSDTMCFTVMGSRTLYCYLVHLLLIHGFYRFINEVWAAAPLSFYLPVFGLFLPLIVGNVLMLGPVVRILRPVIEPNFDFLWRSHKPATSMNAL